ncbi:MAG: immunity 51 family protein [Moraxella sp.]|nr:immunity 51 family protein [Moraxella sp.]
MSDVNTQIRPFKWVEHDHSVSVIMNDVGDYQQFVFDSRADEGFEGSGYDWQSLAVVFLNEKMPHLADKIHFDSESSMFCAYSQNNNALKEFIVAFKNACENDELILDIFSRAILD